MNDPQSSKAVSASSHFILRAVLEEWPYLLMLALALLGIAYTSFSGTPIAIYWIIVAPLMGIICVLTRWQDARTRDERLRLVWTQTSHWAAVLVAMQLMFVADVGKMMNADARALAALVLLALGTFTAGIHIAAWRICLVGLIMAAGVPGIAWLEQSALFLLLAGLALVAIITPFFWHGQRKQGTDASLARRPSNHDMLA